MTLLVFTNATTLIIDAVDNALEITNSLMALNAPLDLMTFSPIFPLLGAAAGSSIVAIAQGMIAWFNAERSDRSRLAGRREEVISEGVLELIRLDPRDGEKNQSALRSAYSIKLFLSEESADDKKLENAVELFVFCYKRIVDSSVDDELIEQIQAIEGSKNDYDVLTMKRSEDLLVELDDARTKILSEARSLIANERFRLRRSSS